MNSDLIRSTVSVQPSYTYTIFQKLESNIDQCKLKFERANRIISGLGGEKERWKQVSISF